MVFALQNVGNRTCVGTSEEGEKVEKVDGALGVVGGNDACGFSGLGLAALS
jgi:hypothetical protein